MGNFFLAIIIDTYAAVKEKVKESVVEKSLVADLKDVLIYPLRRILRGWPHRHKLILHLIQENPITGGRVMDLDNDQTVSALELATTGLFRGSNREIGIKGIKAATHFEAHYLRMESLRTGKEPKGDDLDHVELLE